MPALPANSASPPNPVLLFVDDVPEIVDELVTMFALHDVPAVTAGCLAAALQAICDFPSIRLVASDVRLADEKGEDLLALVADHPQLAGRSLSFLFMTGDLMRFSNEPTLDGHPLLLKPVHPARLLETAFGLLGEAPDGR